MELSEVKDKVASEKLVDRIKRSAEDVGELYPVLVDAETGEILDGRTRSKANPDWHKQPVVTHSEEQRLKIKYHANWHRKDFNRREALEEIAERTGWRGLKPFAKFLGVNESTISRYLSQKYKDSTKSDAGATSACGMQAEKIEKAIQFLGETVKAVEKTLCADEKKSETVQNIKTTQTLLEQIKESIKPEAQSQTDYIDQWLNEIDWQFSLWDCEYERPEGYGDKTFHGNCSPTIIFGMLKKYSTIEDKLIFDPMAGSGTFIDAAKKLGYKDTQILARDIRPLRADIEFGDAETTFLPDSSVDFIFAHYPYWKLIEYSENPNDLSKLNYETFLQKVDRIFKEMHRILSKDRYYIIMIGNLRQSGIIDLESHFSIIGSRYFTLWDKVIKKIRTWEPETRGQRMGLANARAKQHGYTVVNHDTLLVFRKD